MTALRYRDLVERFIADEITPIPPVACWRHHPVDDQSKETMVAATLRFQQRFDCDVVKLTPASSYQLRDLGMSDIWDGDVLGRRSFGAPIATDAAKWEELCRIRQFDHRDIQVRVAHDVRSSIDSQIPIWATVFSPGFLARTLAGDTLTRQFHTNPDLIGEALDALAQMTLDLIMEYFNAGVDGIFFAVKDAWHKRTPSEEYVALDLPRDLRCIEAAHACGTAIVHSHGGPAHPEALRQWKPDVLHCESASIMLNRRLNSAPISAGPGPAEIASVRDPAEMVEIVTALRHTYHTTPMMISSGCVVPCDTDSAVIDALLSAARTAR